MPAISTLPSFLTITQSLSAVTVTQTISEVQQMTTVTADCYDSNFDAMVLCTTTVPVQSWAPSPSPTSKSAAFSNVVNPCKFITDNKIFKLLFGQAYHRSVRYDLDRHIVRRTNKRCAWDIATWVLASLFSLAFLSVLLIAVLRWREGHHEVTGTTKISGVVLVILAVLFFIVAMYNAGYC
jgi:hypothetical protein